MLSYPGQGSNTGFIPVEPKPGDWIAGSETGIIDTPINASANWAKYLPDNQWQRFFVPTTINGVTNSIGFETDACVSFSAEQSVATYLNYQMMNGLMPSAQLAFLNNNGYIVNGKVNFSPRFLAKVSGTTTDGNSLPAVAQAIRTFGLVPDADWPAPIAQLQAQAIKDGTWSQTTAQWNIYYSTIPANVLAKGQAFLQIFTPQYEWINYSGVPSTETSLKNALTIAPLQIATAVCSPWNTAAPINGCGIGAAHATELYNIDANNVYDIEDHYDPFQKQLAANYSIPYSMRLIAIPATPNTPQFPPPANFKYHFVNTIDLGQTNADVTALQNALKVDGEFSQNVESTGYFGPTTQAALEAFQIKYKIATSGTPTTTGFGRVGPKTIAQLNVLFNK